MAHFTSNDETPCPIRGISPLLGYSRSSTTAQQTSFPSVGQWDDFDDTSNLDVTIALPDPNCVFKPGRRHKGLREPPRRFTNHVSAKPALKETEKTTTTTTTTTTAGAATISTTIPTKLDDDVTGVPLLIEPERRKTGLQQPPQRLLINPVDGRASTRRISAILRAKKQEQNVVAPVPSPVTAVVEVDKGQRARVSWEKPKPVLGEKSRNTSMPRSKTTLGGMLVPPLRRSQWVPKGDNGKENSEGINGARKTLTLDDSDNHVKKLVKLSNEPARIPKKKYNGPTFKEPTQPIQPARKISAGSRKRTSEYFGDDTSFSSNYSDASYNQESDSLRLKKRVKTSISSLPSPPSLGRDEDAVLIPPTDFFIPGPVSYNPAPAKKRPLDPILAEDLERCEMYEESWISAQESSVSQLLNRLLAEHSPAPIGKHRLALRKEFLSIYQAAPFPSIFKRVNASLLYGALSITQHVLEKSSASRTLRTILNGQLTIGWGADLGAREKFMTLFLDTYDQTTLVTALEAVVAREMFAQTTSGEPEKKVLEGYIDRYIIRSEDLLAIIPGPDQKRCGSRLGDQSGGNEDKGSPAWFLRQTLLRSFMLILLLDKAKFRGILGKQCLFKTNSVYKSSLNVLNALSRLLLPSIGDISKPLSRLNYTLESTQSPLSEYDYTIQNLAVDIRDGVRLARVAEVLLHSKRRTSLPHGQDYEEEDWPLSIHLHYPAPSRAQKLHNVSLVLSYLVEAGGNPQSVEAKDIVDGHREKTVGLLWSLLNQWGLEMLVDWNIVKQEIRKLNRELFPNINNEEELQSTNHNYVGLLECWASSIGIKHGLVVKNLTTSFADGGVFAAIVDEYEEFLPSYSKKNSADTLDVKLKGIGCNSYFAGLFKDVQINNGRVFNQDFVVAGLSYLCSRLLQPSITERAAITIQRWYRGYLFRMNVHKRITLLLLAHDCADYVNTRSRVLNAVIKIQRAYREFIHVKIQRLLTYTVEVQTLIRGTLVRRDVGIYRSAVILIQKRWRSIREARYQKRIECLRNTITCIQPFLRGFILRKKLSELKKSVCMVEYRLENIWLGRSIRENYLAQRGAAILIQRTFRRFSQSRKARSVFIQARKSTLTLQAIVRGYFVRKNYERTVKRARFLQTKLRQFILQRRARFDYLNLRKFVVYVQRRRRETIHARSLRAGFLSIQKLVGSAKKKYREKKRTFNAILVLQRAWRCHAWLVRMRRKFQEVIRIQSAWRGYIVRKGSSPRIRITRKRLHKIKEQGVKKQATVGFITEKALQSVKIKSGVARAILQLEFCTTNLAECTKMVAEDEAGFSAILSSMEAIIPQIQKSSVSTVARGLITATKIVANVARIPSCSAIVASAPPAKGTKDVFSILALLLGVVKMAPANTSQYELLMLTLAALEGLTRSSSIRRRLLGRKKWVEKLKVDLLDVKKTGNRRGAIADVAKEKLVAKLLDLFP